MYNTAWHSVAAALCAVWALAPAPAWADTGMGGRSVPDESLWTYELVNGTATVTSGPAEGDIVVPATLGGCPVDAIAYWAFQGCSGLHSVTLPATISDIGDNAFQGCDALVEFRLPPDALHCTVRDGVLFTKDMKTLLLYPPGKAGAYAIPEGVETIAGFAFASDAVTSLSIPGTVAAIGDFALCLGRVPTLVVPESVTAIGAGVFLWCSGLRTLYLPSTWKSTTLLEDSGGAPGCTVIYYPTLAERRYAAWLETLDRPAADLPMDGDADLDGASNWEECVAGTDPFDRAAGFSARIRTHGGKTLVEPSAAASGRVYRVYGTASLPVPGGTPPAWDDVTGIPDLSSGPWRYFRLGVDFAE